MGVGIMSGCVAFDESLLSQDGGADQHPDGTALEDTSGDTPSDTPGDVPSDAPQDVPSDTPQDSPQDTPVDTPQDTPMDAPPPLGPLCVSYDHNSDSTYNYFYPGNANQDCNDVCASHGLYSNATKNVVGHEGNNAHCRRVIRRMFHACADSVSTGTYATGVGCARQNSGTLKRFTSPDTTANAAGADIERVCACNSDDGCEVQPTDDSCN